MKGTWSNNRVELSSGVCNLLLKLLQMWIIFFFKFSHALVAVFTLVEGMVEERGNQRKEENTAFGISNSLHCTYFLLSLFFVVNNEILNTKRSKKTQPTKTKIGISGRIELSVVKLPYCLYLKDALSSESLLDYWRKKRIAVTLLSSSQPNSSVVKNELSC